MRQGDPLSPYLFIIGVEILSQAITSNPGIKGVFIEGNQFLLGQYADDTSIFIDGTEKSLKNVFNVLNNFELLSGLCTNYEKTQAVWIGVKRNSNDRIKTNKQLSWTNGNFKVLGVTLNANLSNLIEINFRDKIKECKELLNIWRQRNLTIIGKITIIKSLILSKFNHLFSFLPSPSLKIIKEIEKMVYEFVWNGKGDRVSRNILINRVDMGGVKMPHIASIIKSQKSSWIKRTLSIDNKEWGKMFNIIFRFCGGAIVWEYTVDGIRKVGERITNEFWRELINIWSGIVEYNGQMNTANDFLRQILWYNSSIKDTLFIHSWHKAKVDYVNDVVKKNGQIMSHKEFQQIYVQRETIKKCVYASAWQNC